MTSVTYGKSIYGNCDYSKSIIVNVTEPIDVLCGDWKYPIVNFSKRQ